MRAMFHVAEHEVWCCSEHIILSRRFGLTLRMNIEIIGHLLENCGRYLSAQPRVIASDGFFPRDLESQEDRATSACGERMVIEMPSTTLTRHHAQRSSMNRGTHGVHPRRLIPRI